MKIYSMALLAVVCLLCSSCEDDDYDYEPVLSGHHDLLIVNNTSIETELSYPRDSGAFDGFPRHGNASVGANHQIDVEVWYSESGEARVTATQNDNEKTYRVWHEQSVLAIDPEDFD
jgi:hypothetical protein